MIKAWIEIILDNGQLIKYVNETVTDSNGVNKEYYAYTGEAGDQYADQTTAGQIKSDYEAIVASFSVPDNPLSFPESSGATTELVRRNDDQRESLVGNIRTVVNSSIINTIRVVEYELDPEWYV